MLNNNKSLFITLAILGCISVSILLITMSKKKSINIPNKDTSLTINRSCQYKVNSDSQKFDWSGEIINLSDKEDKLDYVNLVLDTSSNRNTKYILINSLDNKVLLNTEYFESEGKIVQVEGLVRKSESQVFTKIKKDNVKPEEYSQLIRDLVESSIIRTFIHTNSVVCFYNEKLENNEYSVNLEVIHYYYTNSSNEAKYNSKIVIDKEGNITIN